MIILKSAKEIDNEVFSNHYDISGLTESMRNAILQSDPYQKVFIWNNFCKESSKFCFDDKEWPAKFAELFGNQEMWPWKFRFAGSEEDRTGNSDLVESLKNTNQGIIASLRIRNFDSNDRFQGSLAWLEEITTYLNFQNNNFLPLFENLTLSIRLAKNSGIYLYLEKISILVNPDPENSISLTPHLHRDGSYSILESAIVSFYSESSTPHASTLFFPYFNFEAASHLKPITAAKLISYFSNSSAYSISSGSLAIYSGKLGIDGTKSDSRGALHMSPEGFYPTCRLILLFRSEINK